VKQTKYLPQTRLKTLEKQLHLTAQDAAKIPKFGNLKTY